MGKTNYNNIEIVIGGVKNRNSVLDLRDASALFSKSEKLDCHRSLFRFSEDMQRHINSSNSIKGFDGSVFCDQVVIDFDSKLPTMDEAISESQAELVKVLDTLNKLGVADESIAIAFSGKKGFHLSLPASWIGISDEFDIVSRIKHVVKNLTKDCKLVDFQLYHKTALIRIKGSKHPASGLYKIPLIASEVRTLEASEIREIAKNPREVDLNKTVNYDNSLSCLLDGYADALRNTKEESKVKSPDLYGHKLCVIDIMQGVSDGERDACAIRMAVYYRRLGFNRGNALEYVNCWNKLNNPPLTMDEIETKVDSAYENATYDYGCNDAILSNHCKSGCYLSKQKGEEENKIWSAKQMHEHFAIAATDLNLMRRIDFNLMPEISKSMQGLRGGELVYLAARSGVGKSKIMQSICQDEAKKGKGNVLMVSLEMPIELVWQRALSLETGLSSEDIEDCYVKSDFNWFLKSIKELENFYVIETPALSLNNIESAIMKLGDVKLVAIDFLGLINSPGKNDYEKVSAAAYGAKNLAKKLNVPIIMVAQLSRAAGSGDVPVELTHLRDSGKTEESADVIVGIWQDQDEPRKLIAKALKVRKGIAGTYDYIGCARDSVKMAKWEQKSPGVR